MLIETQDLLEFALEISHIGAWEFDLDDHKVRRSLQHDRIYGYGDFLPEWTYEMFLDHVLPEDRAEVDRTLRSSAEAGSDLSFECRIRRADGEVRWICAAGRLRADPEGRSRRMTGIVQDITERKQAAANNERLLALMDHNPSLVFLKDEDGRYVYLNAAYEKHFALSPEWQGKTDYDFWPRESADLFRAHDAEVLRSGEVRQFMEDCPDRDATRHCWLCYKFPFTDSSGRKYVGGIGIDTVGRVLAEEALVSAHRQIQSIIDNTTSLIYAFDLQERFLLANATVAELFNTTPEQMIGKRRHEFMPKDDADWHEANDRRVIEEGEALEFEEYSKLGSRSITWLTTKFPLRDACGRIYAVAGISTDVSERRESEDRLREAYRREHHVAEVLQNAIIPPEPFISDDYPAAAAYLAYPGQDVGGDFYDVFPVDDGRVGILIGDVSGKGVEAASLATMARSTIRAMAHVSRSPGEALVHANEVLCTAQPSGAFVTACLAYLDPRTGRVVGSSAGHPPPAILRADGRVAFTGGSNPPLSVHMDQEFGEDEYRLDPGDTVVFYTDGVDEARRGGVLFGFDGIERILRENRGAAPERICERLFAAVNEWTHGAFRDDTAIVVVQRKL